MRSAEARHAEGAAANSRAAETRDTEGASTDARPAETRDAEGATAPEASTARGKAHTPASPKAAVAAKAPTVPAKAPTVPAEASSAGVGFKREKRNGEEQHRDSANAGHRPPAPGAGCGRHRRNAPTPIPGLGELLRRGRPNVGIFPRRQSLQGGHGRLPLSRAAPTL